MTFKHALNLITIRDAPFEKKLELAQAAGYDGVGLWLGEVEQAAGGAAGLDGIARRLRERGLIPAEMCFVGGWMYPEEGTRAAAHESAQRAFRVAQAVGCQCVVACAAGGTGELTDAARDFAELCDLARPFGVSLALEFLGGAQQVKDVRTAWQIVDMADAPNGGLVIDTFHFYKGGSDLADLEPVTGDKVFLVHANDCPDLPLAELEDRHRVFPGAGIIPLEEIAAVLADKGYGGFFSLELFNEEYWATDPHLVAQEGLRSLRRVGI
ncbi:MAG: sugar phosphate isomerase/epimerase [Armatimonadota bacterium]|nr:MAG: sugar phosphate isomerase/epimerase [Armatimonadota bacterium]